MARRNPVRVIRSGLTGTVYALTNYRERENGLITVIGQGKHDVSADVEAIVAERCAPLVEFAELAQAGRFVSGEEVAAAAHDVLRVHREREGGVGG